MNIRGFVNARQLVIVIASSGLVGLSAADEYIMRHPADVNAAFGPVLATLLTASLASVMASLTGRPVEEVAKDVADKVLGDEKK